MNIVRFSNAWKFLIVWYMLYIIWKLRVWASKWYIEVDKWQKNINVHHTFQNDNKGLFLNSTFIALNTPHTTPTHPDSKTHLILVVSKLSVPFLQNPSYHLFETLGIREEKHCLELKNADVGGARPLRELDFPSWPLWSENDGIQSWCSSKFAFPYLATTVNSSKPTPMPRPNMRSVTIVAENVTIQMH